MTRSPWWRWLLVLCCAPLALLTAQTTVTLQARDGKALGTVRVWPSGGVTEGFGIGFARVRVENVSAVPQRVAVALNSERRGSSDVQSSRTVELEAGEVAQFFLPLPVPPAQTMLRVDIDGSTTRSWVDCSRGDGAVTLAIVDRPAAQPAALALGGSIPSAWTGGNAPAVYSVAANELPADWRLLTSFSSIVVDGTSALDAEHQEAIRRYAAAGGTVVVAAPGQLPSGPLREVAERRSGPHLLGRIVAVDDLDDGPAQLGGRLAGGRPSGVGLFPASGQLVQEQSIEGLGRAPVTAFVLVILLFAMLVGPVNFFVLRRRRQPLLALLTVPVLGFGTTVLILGYGIFQDGFGVRGVVTSWTVLDQARHECTAIAARTLFAGLRPNDLTMGKDAVLVAPRAAARYGNEPDQWVWDADRERLDGGVLPSRVPTPLLTVQQGTARERLALRHLGDDGLEVLPGGGIEPVGAFVLRDLDGTYWQGQDGRLSKVKQSVGEAAFARLAAASAQFDRVELRSGRVVGSSRPAIRLVPDDLGAPGSYIAEVGAAPWLDQHGLSIDYDEQHHFVFGRLHAEDFVR